MSLWGSIKKVGGTIAKAAVNPLGTVAGALGAPAGVQAALNPVGYLAGKAVDAAGNLIDGGGGTGPDVVAPGVASSLGNLAQNDSQNRALYDQLLAERAGAGKFAAPQVQTQDVSAPANVQFQDVNAPAKIQSRDVSGYGQVAGETVAAPNAVQTQQVDGATIDDAQGQEIRGRQTGYLDAITARMNGTAPSVAAEQQTKALDQITAEQTGLAAQAHGNQGVFARREAMRNIAGAQQQTTLDKALLRANETTAAAGMVGGALSDVRGTDTATAVHAADLRQGADISNQGQAGLNDRFSSGAATDVAKTNADRSVAVGTTNVGNALTAQTGNANRGLAADTASSDAATAVATGNANRNVAVQGTNITNATGVATGNADRGVAVQGTNATNALTGNAQNVNEKAGLLTGAQTATGQIGASGAVAANTNEEEAKRLSDYHGAAIADNKKLAGAALGGAATTGAALLGGSDERMKKNIREASGPSFLDHLTDKYYEYKNPAEGPGTREGGMTADLKKSEVGRNLVHAGPDGMERVDTAGLTLALAGAVARMRREMKGRGEAR
jgi:hypothetical protein